MSKKHILNNRAFTLVELVVCMALTAILATAVVTVMFPATNVFMKMQKLTRAQMIADLVTDSLRKECADTYISSYADARVISVNNATNYKKGDDAIFSKLTGVTGQSDDSGNVLVIRKSDNILEAIYWNLYITGDDYKEATGSDMVTGANTVTTKAVYRLFPNSLTIDASNVPKETIPGYLHFGYYSTKNNNVNIGGVDVKLLTPDKAYDYTNPFPVSSYNGYTVSVTFSDFTYEIIEGGSDTNLADKRPAYVYADIKIYDSNFAGQSEDSLLYKRSTVLCFSNDNINE